MIVYGTGTYGKVDAVAGIGHVATQFFTLYYLPILPLGTYFVTSEENNSIHGVKLPFNLKSIGVAYLRGLLAVGALVSIGTAIWAFVNLNKIAGNDHVIVGVACALLAPVAIGLFILTYRVAMINRATYERAQQLADACGFSVQGRLMIEVLYGRVTPEAAADALMQDAEMQAAEVDPTLGPGGNSSV